MKTLFSWLFPAKKWTPSFVVISEKQPRFSIKMANGVERKIFTYFPAARDGSIAFHTYFDIEWSSDFWVDRQSNQANRVTYEFNLDDVERREDFTTNKINFHKSGVVKFKTKEGTPISNELKKTLSFENYREDQIHLAWFAPAKWDLYPKIDDDKTYVELTQGNLNVIPPIIEFYVARDASQIVELARKHKRKKVWFVDELILAKFELKFFISVTANLEGDYPPGQLFCLINR